MSLPSQGDTTLHGVDGGVLHLTADGDDVLLAVERGDDGLMITLDPATVAYLAGWATAHTRVRHDGAS